MNRKKKGGNITNDVPSHPIKNLGCQLKRTYGLKLNGTSEEYEAKWNEIKKDKRDRRVRRVRRVRFRQPLTDEIL